MAVTYHFICWTKESLYGIGAFEFSGRQMRPFLFRTEGQAAPKKPGMGSSLLNVSPLGLRLFVVRTYVCRNLIADILTALSSNKAYAMFK
jgi:hypothetical protein